MAKKNGRPKVRTIEQIEGAVERFIDKQTVTGESLDPWLIVEDLERMPAQLDAIPSGREQGQHRGDVDVLPFREAFENSGMSKKELARRMGWFYRKGGRIEPTPDGGRAHKTLYHYRRVRRHTAEKLMEALHLDPMDCGL